MVRLLLSVLTVPLLIRLIGLGEYGLWAFVSATIAMVTLVEAGLSLSTTVFVSRDLASGDRQGVMTTLTITTLAMGCLASVAATGLWLAAEPLSRFLPDLSPVQRSQMAQAFSIGAVAVWARLIQQVLAGLKQAYQRYDLLNLLQTGQAIGLTLGSLTVAWRGGGIVELMQWQAVVVVICLLLHMFFGLRLLVGGAIRPRWDAVKARQILRYSLTAWFGIIGTAVFSQADKLIVGAILGPVALGLYAAVTSITAQINSLSAVTIEPHFPVITQLFSAQTPDLSALRERFHQTLALNTAVALGLGSALLGGSRILLEFILPGADQTQLAVFWVGIVIYALYSLNAAGSYVLFGSDKVFLGSALSVGSGVLALVLISVGSQTFGMMGAMLGNGGYIATLAFYWFSMQKLGLTRWAWLKWIRTPLICFLTGAASIFLVPLRADLLLIIGTILGCTITCWFAFIQREMLLHVVRRLFLIRI